MSWSRIKTLLLALLLAVNIYLVYAIASQYRVTSRIAPEEIDAASELLKRDGLIVDPDSLTGKRLDLKVWRSTFQDGENEESGRESIISRLFGSASYTSHMTGAGIEVTVEGIGTLSFSDSDPLFIGYMSDGCSYDGSYDEAASDPESDRQVSWMRRKNLSNQLNQFLSGGEGSSLTSDEKRAETEVDLAIYDRSERRYIAHFRQKLDGCVIDGSGGYLSVKNDKIEYLKCSVVLLSRPVGYNADLLDEINVLFLERDAFADATVFSEDESLSSAPSPEETTRHVTGSSPLYCVIWNSDRSEFYLIPSWMIEYSDGSESKRNAVNGNVYSR